MQVKRNSKKIKEENLDKIKHNNMQGITLIALAVTIIVLIILAGVSINLVLGDNGIITKAKEAKTKTEQAILNEEVALNEIAEYLENNGGTSNPPEEIKTIAELKETGTYMTEKATLKDSNGNIIKVPEGFKIAEDSGINVTEGIVIEDNDIKTGIGNNRGNQYVWIPVGNGIKKSDGTIVNITLGRYDFANGTNDKAEDGTTALAKGTPILKQSAENYTSEVIIDSYYKELATSRTGSVDTSNRLNDINTTALNLKGFIDSVKANGGYYIARYEASYGFYGTDTTPKAKSKVSNSAGTTAPTTEGVLWNCITQIDAATASRGLYTTATTDLINSYAWDTAIVYIQEFSGDTDYSYQTSKNTGSNPANTGANGDEVCKINDMASNICEWTTEYNDYTKDSCARPCTLRGGNCFFTSDLMSYRYYDKATFNGMNSTFRSALYM